jgi:hypothetical protein
MSNIFSQIGNIDLESAFQNADQCLELLAAEKWKDGYICRKCGNTNYCSGKTLHSRRCTRCKHDESATANTIFHRCKIPLNEAFKIAYIVCNQPDISTYDISLCGNPSRSASSSMINWKLLFSAKRFSPNFKESSDNSELISRSSAFSSSLSSAPLRTKLL